MPIVKIVPMPGPQGATGSSATITGATGTFVSDDNKTITVVNGIITSIQAIV